MKRSYLFLSTLAILCWQISAATIYVSPEGANEHSGNSWENAVKSIHYALSIAEDNDEVWVSQGNYVEYQSLTIGSNQGIYGGFSGTELERAQREPETNQTFIKGTYTSVSLLNSGIVDGFWITQAYTACKNQESGILRNCWIYENRTAEDGILLDNSGEVYECRIYSNTKGFITNKSLFINTLVYNNQQGIQNQSGTIRACTIVKNEHTGIDNQSGRVENSICCFNGQNITDTEGCYYNCLGKSSYSENGNIAANPKFVDLDSYASSWDLHLQDGSPCVDKGSLDFAPEEDIEGTTRPGSDNKTCMGAYESPAEYETGEIIIDRYYVSPDGDNTDGLSWQTAFHSIPEAIESQPDGLLELWIKEGFYQYEEPLIIPQNCTLVGGFAGTEDSIEERIPEDHSTILYSTSYYSAVLNYGTLDTLTVTKDPSCSNYTGISEGGGIKNYGVVKSCLITGNNAQAGGGIYNYYGSRIINCILSDNGAGSGGGIYNAGGMIIESEIYSNIGTNGQGIYNQSGQIQSSNIHHNGRSDITFYQESLDSLTKTYNYPSGGGIYLEEGTVEACTISDNTSTAIGGIYAVAGTITNCNIYGNQATRSSGGCSIGVHGALIDCKIYDNEVNNYDYDLEYYQWPGGASSSGTIRNCHIYNNYSPCTGGFTSTGTIDNCRIFNNESIYYSGGGIVIDGSISNSLIYNNISEKAGGLMLNYREPDLYVNYGTVPRIIHCVAYGNRPNGIMAYHGEIFNSICWNNRLTIMEDEGIRIENCCYTDPLSQNSEYGNIFSGPMFVDAQNYDFHLTNGSPCIDHGMFLPDYTTDLEGNIRPGEDEKVCIGAYESPDEYEPASSNAPLDMFVSLSGNNTDGLSWQTAFTSISHAVFSAELYSRRAILHVSEGLYETENSITIPEYMSIFGGYSNTDPNFPRNPVLYPSIIDGKNDHTCVLNRGRFEGFTIINGLSIYSGGGLINEYGIVRDCIFNNNQGYSGGGSLIKEGIIQSCKFYQNKAYYGGGVYLESGDLMQSFVYDNESMIGGGCYNNGNIWNCLVYQNQAIERGGGIYNNSNNLVNSTIYENQAVTGGGIFANDSHVVNCIIYANQGLDIISEEYLEIHNTCFAKEEHLGSNGATLINCIQKSPLFVNTEGDNPSTWDFRLQSDSPCIGAGTRDLEYPDTDILGNLRPYDRPIDIGAYGYYLETSVSNRNWNLYQ